MEELKLKNNKIWLSEHVPPKYIYKRKFANVRLSLKSVKPNSFAG